MTDYRAIRGGSWHVDDKASLAARARLRLAPSYRDNNLGFRCARTRQQTIIRVFRGGGWGNVAAYCRAASRGYNGPENRNNSLGFRVIRRKT